MSAVAAGKHGMPHLPQPGTLICQQPRGQYHPSPFGKPDARRKPWCSASWLEVPLGAAAALCSAAILGKALEFVFGGMAGDSLGNLYRAAVRSVACACGRSIDAQYKEARARDSTFLKYTQAKSAYFMIYFTYKIDKKNK